MRQNSVTGRHLRYVRDQLFPVADPHLTLKAYTGIFARADQIIDQLPRWMRTIIIESRIRLLAYSLSLPASSTFHHRTAGGLFYHSVETATIAARIGQAEFPHPDRAAWVLACYLSGLLHDVAKAETLFEVYQADDRQHDVDFGGLEGGAGQGGMLMWSPHQCSLYTWCKHYEVRFLSLRYKSGLKTSHDMLVAEWLERIVPIDDLMAFKNADLAAYQAFRNWVDRSDPTGLIGQIVKEADNESIRRDMDPTFRWGPKDSRAHIVRRFLEWAALSEWNTEQADFFLVNVARRDTTAMAFCATEGAISRFIDYLFSEDLYGHAIGDPVIDQVYMALEQENVLIRMRTDPDTWPVRNSVVPAYWAELQTPTTTRRIPVSFIPNRWPFGVNQLTPWVLDMRPLNIKKT